MPELRRLYLTRAQRQELPDVRDHAPAPYVRERAAALLKIADGHVLKHVARHGLLRPCDKETVSGWLDRYQAGGAAGLCARPGRGRKPAYFP